MIRIQQVSHADAHAAIHDVRQRVFVQEQGIAAALERDALDPVSAHVLALDADGQPVGTEQAGPGWPHRPHGGIGQSSQPGGRPGPAGGPG